MCKDLTQNRFDKNEEIEICNVIDKHCDNIAQLAREGAKQEHIDKEKRILADKIRTGIYFD